MAEKSIETLLVDLANAKSALTAATQNKDAIEQDLVAAYKAQGKKTGKVTAEDGRTVSGTLVQGQTVKTNEIGLKKALGSAVWNKVTKRVLAKDLLEAAIAMKEVDPNVVAAHSEVSDSKPYIRVTVTQPTNAFLTAQKAARRVRGRRGVVTP